MKYPGTSKTQKARCSPGMPTWGGEQGKRKKGGLDAAGNVREFARFPKSDCLEGRYQDIPKPGREQRRTVDGFLATKICVVKKVSERVEKRKHGHYQD